MLTENHLLQEFVALRGFMNLQAKTVFRKIPCLQRDVLERLLHGSHLQTRAAHEVEAQELIDVWVFSNVYPNGINSVTVGWKDWQSLLQN